MIPNLSTSGSQIETKCQYLPQKLNHDYLIFSPGGPQIQPKCQYLPLKLNHDY